MKNLLSFTICLLLLSCGSTQVVEHYKDNQTPVFEANKVLVVGLTQDLDNRRLFEETLSQKLEANQMVAVRSSDFFEQLFNDQLSTEQELDAIEESLLSQGFDAILLSQIIGVENKTTLISSFREINDTYRGFREDYIFGQNQIDEQQDRATYNLYHTETNLYCICPEEERELLWSVKIDLVERNLKPNIRSYVSMLIKTLKKDQYLIVE